MCPVRPPEKIPRPLPLSSQPHENNQITFNKPYSAYQNKGLTRSQFPRIFKNKALAARTKRLPPETPTLKSTRPSRGARNRYRTHQVPPTSFCSNVSFFARRVG